jgi:hypothetical protein
VAQETYFQQMNSLNSAVPLTLPAGVADYTRVAMVLVQAEAQAVRWRQDGTNPTAAIGHVLVANDSAFFDRAFSKLRFIAAAAGAILNVTWYVEP